MKGCFGGSGYGVVGGQPPDPPLPLAPPVPEGAILPSRLPVVADVDLEARVVGRDVGENAVCDERLAEDHDEEGPDEGRGGDRGDADPVRVVVVHEREREGAEDLPREKRVSEGEGEDGDG